MFLETEEGKKNKGQDRYEGYICNPRKIRMSTLYGGGGDSNE